jgi:hypothetical protein
MGKGWAIMKQMPSVNHAGGSILQTTASNFGRRELRGKTRMDQSYAASTFAIARTVSKYTKAVATTPPRLGLEYLWWVSKRTHQD